MATIDLPDAGNSDHWLCKIFFLVDAFCGIQHCLEKARCVSLLGTVWKAAVQMSALQFSGVFACI